MCISVESYTDQCLQIARHFQYQDCLEKNEWRDKLRDSTKFLFVIFIGHILCSGNRIPMNIANTLPCSGYAHALPTIPAFTNIPTQATHVSNNII